MSTNTSTPSSTNTGTNSSTEINLQAEVPDNLSGSRLDQIAAILFPDYSRARLQTWIKDGSLLVNDQQLRPKDRVNSGDNLVVEAILAKVDDWAPEPVPLNIVYEDEHLIVLNKATDTVVHPAAGHHDGTLLNGLLHHCPELEELPRAGIVHRLDKDTTGLMVVAKTLPSHTSLVRQLQARDIAREYQAVVQGVLTGGGTIDEPLDRHPVNRKKRAVVHDGQDAVTHYRLIRRYRAHSHVWVKLETGRTHQIRVHMAHRNYPLVGDPLYGGRLQIPAGCSEELRATLKGFRRQALHATRLALAHPVSGEEISWEAPRPDDMELLLAALTADQELVDG
ncbi:MAG: 23S rRNA pseudouridine(1911/1915/1917) synthase RluD [Gammaproteobacteria bacterium]